MPTQLPFSPRHLRGPAGDGSPASPNATPPPKMQERRDWTEYFPFGSDSRGQGRPRMRLSERIISGAWLRARLNRPPGCAKGALYEALVSPGVRLEKRDGTLCSSLYRRRPRHLNSATSPSARPPVARQGERGARVTSASRPSIWGWGCMSGQFALPDRLKGPGGRELIAVRGSTRSCRIDRCPLSGVFWKSGASPMECCGSGDLLVVLFDVEIVSSRNWCCVLALFFVVWPLSSTTLNLGT